MHARKPKFGLLRAYFEIFYPSLLFPFAFLLISIFIAHFIVFLSHGVSRKGYILIHLMLGNCFLFFLSVTVRICQNLLNKIPVERSNVANFAKYYPLNGLCKAEWVQEA